MISELHIVCSKLSLNPLKDSKIETENELLKNCENKNFPQINFINKLKFKVISEFYQKYTNRNLKFEKSKIWEIWFFQRIPK